MWSWVSLREAQVRALAVTSRERNPALPDVPTVIESEIKGFEVVGFYGFLAPAGTPKEVVNKLSDAFKQVLPMPEVRNRMIRQGADPAFLGADDFALFLAAGMPRWAAAASKSGAKPDETTLYKKSRSQKRQLRGIATMA